MRYSTLIFMVIMLGFFYSCSIGGEVNTSDPQFSKSIAEAKSNGTYVCSYTFLDDKGLKKSAWLEKVWFNSDEGGIKVEDRYQLVFSTENLIGSCNRSLPECGIDIVDESNKHVSFRGNFVNYYFESYPQDRLKLNVIGENLMKIELIFWK